MDSFKTLSLILVVFVAFSAASSLARVRREQPSTVVTKCLGYVLTMDTNIMRGLGESGSGAAGANGNLGNAGASNNGQNGNRGTEGNDNAGAQNANGASRVDAQNGPLNRATNNGNFHFIISLVFGDS